MNERSNLISKLQSDFKTRAAYIQAKVSTLVPSQIRALRLKSEMPRQPDLAREAEMHQSRISMLETAGANPTLSTLSTIAAALKVGLKVEFVPFSEMLAWENEFSQDTFNPTRIDQDAQFINPLRPALADPVRMQARLASAQRHIACTRVWTNARVWQQAFVVGHVGFSRGRYWDLWGAPVTVTTGAPVPAGGAAGTLDQPFTANTQGPIEPATLWTQSFANPIAQQPLITTP